MRPLFLLLGLAGCGIGSDDVERIDRTAFDLDACPPGETSPLAGLTPSVPVDSLEVRTGQQTAVVQGEPCSGAADRTACEQARAAVDVEDGWSTGPGGGMPAPIAALVYTRGDEVGEVGAGELSAFLAPVDDAFDAAFLASVATLGAVDCSTPAVRAVEGGWEVVTTTSGYCSATSESRVFVDDDGGVSIEETVVISEGPEQVCP